MIKERENIIISNNTILTNEITRLKEQIQILQNKSVNDVKLIQMEKHKNLVNKQTFEEEMKEEIQIAKQKFKLEGIIKLKHIIKAY